MGIDLFIHKLRRVYYFFNVINVLILNKTIKTKELSTWYKYFICAIASSYAMFDFFIIVAPSVMSNEIRLDFQINATQFSYIGASFYIAYALMQIPSGWLIDRYGMRKMFSFAATLTGLSVILFSTTNNFSVCLFARALMGIGVSSAFIGNYYLAARLIKHRYFSFFAAILHLLASVGAFIAQGPLAVAVQSSNWRQTMFINGLIALLLACLFAVFIDDGQRNVPEKKQPNRKIPFLNSMKYIINHAQVKWIALCGFMGWLPLSVLSGFWGIPYLMTIYQIDSITASSILTYFWLGSACGGLLISMFSELISSRKKPILYCFYGQVICAIIMINATLIPPWVISLTFFCLGVFVCMQTLSFTLIKETVEPRYFALATSANNIGAMLSSAIGQNLFGWLLDYQAGNSLNYTATYFQKAMFMFLVAAISGTFICKYKLKETHCCVLKY